LQGRRPALLLLGTAGGFPCEDPWITDSDESPAPALRIQPPPAERHAVQQFAVFLQPFLMVAFHEWASV
jgi:hypothetical protein